MKTLLIGQHFAAEHPILVEELRMSFTVEVFNYLTHGSTIESLAGQEVAAIITRPEYLSIFSSLSTLLAPIGTNIGHCIAWGTPPSPWFNIDVKKIGLCGCVDVSLPSQVVISEVETICTSCEHHPLTSLVDDSVYHSGLSEAFNIPVSLVDDVIADLVVHGFTDREIAEIIHFSSQTITNRVSRILRTHGFHNRTDLASARQRHSIQAYVAKSPEGVYGVRNDEPSASQ